MNINNTKNTNFSEIHISIYFEQMIKGYKT